MGTVIHVEFESKDNEYESAMSELVQALRKVIDLSVGTEAAFSEKEVATLAGSSSIHSRRWRMATTTNCSSTECATSVVMIQARAITTAFAGH